MPTSLNNIFTLHISLILIFGVTLASFPNAKIVDDTAEATTLSDYSVDVITCAQALHWFDPEAFRAECRRIGKSDVLVIAIYNNTPGGSSITHSKQSTDVFFNNPTLWEFSNPMFYTRDSWLQYMTSHSHDPLPSDAGFADVKKVWCEGNTTIIVAQKAI